MAETIVIPSVAGKRCEFIPSNVVPFVKVSMKNFAEGERTVMASTKKLSLLTSKNAQHVKVINRLTGRFVDITDLVKTPIVDAYALSYEASVFGVVAKGGFAALVAVNDQADGELSYETKTVQFPEDISRIAVVSVAGTVHSEADKLAQKEIVGLGTNGTVHVADVESGRSRPLLTKTVAVDVPFLDFNYETRLLASPGSRGTVQLTFLDSGKAVLERSWAPHSNDPISALAILPKVSVAHGTLIVTCSDNNTDVRLWALKDGVVSLQQSLLVSGATAEEAGTPRLLTVDPSGDYVMLASTADADASMVMLEVDNTRGRFRRSTDWNLLSGVVALNAIVRKRKQGASVIVETAAVIRTSEKVSMVVFDAEKLTGSANIGADAAAAGGKTGSNVLKWFGSTPAPAAPLQRESSAVVSSSLDKKEGAAKSGPTAAVVEKQGLAALQKQNSNVTSLLDEIDQRVVALQQLATQSLKALQAQSVRDAARAAGQDHGTRSTFRPAGAQASQSAGLPPQTTEVIRSFSEAVKTGIRESATRCIEQSLAKNLPAATAKSMDYMEAAEKSNSALPKLASTEGMQQFQAAIDKLNAAQIKMIKAESGIAARTAMVAVSGSKEAVESAVSRFQQYVSKVNAEVKLLRNDVAELRAKGGVGSAPAEPLTLEKVHGMLAAGNWVAAFAAVVEAADVDLLINVLESEPVERHRDTLLNPATLPFPIVLAVLKQLAHDLDSRLGAIPLRVGWISEFAMDWDEKLHDMAANKGDDARALRQAADAFAEIVEALSAVNVKGKIDTTSRRAITTAVKVFKPFASA